MSTPQPNRCRMQYKCCTCGSPVKLSSTTLFPTTSQRIQIEHRAGVLKYPKPDTDRPILSAATEKILQLRRELKKQNESRNENECKDNSSVRSEEENMSVSSSQGSERSENEQITNLQSALDQERDEKELLQAKLHKLAEITRNLVDAMSKCKEILDADQMIENAERCLEDI